MISIPRFQEIPRDIWPIIKNESEMARIIHQYFYKSFRWKHSKHPLRTNYWNHINRKWKNHIGKEEIKKKEPIFFRIHFE